MERTANIRRSTKEVNWRRTMEAYEEEVWNDRRDIQ
jgi:hypothetical protein